MEIAKSRKSYTANQKLIVVEFAELHGNRHAGREFGVGEKSVRDWRRCKAQLQGMAKQKRANRGRKCLWPKVEDALSEWVAEQRRNLIPVSKHMIRVKAVEVARNLGEANFSGCISWCNRFMKRKGLSLRKRTRISQKMPSDYEDKLISFQRFMIKMRQKNSYELGQIGNMDEVPMCFDMPPDRTVNKAGEKTVQIKTSGHEKSHFTVVLSCCADGTKLPPLVIFKRKTIPKERMPAGVIVRVHEKGWMEEKGMIDWIKTVWGRRPGSLLKNKSILVMDAFRGHLHDSVRQQLKLLKADIAVIPGGMTGVLQPLDVGVNKPFKDRIRAKWVDWLSQGEHSFTPNGNLKRPTLATVCSWVKESWDDIPTDIIVRAFKKTSISNRMDGTEDDALFNSGIDYSSSESERESVADPYDDLAAVRAIFENSDSESEFLGFTEDAAIRAIFEEDSSEDEFFGFA